MAPLTPEEQQLVSDPKLLEVCKSVATGFKRSHWHLGDYYDEFLSACHMALVETARNFDASRGSIGGLLAACCRYQCIAVARRLKRQGTAGVGIEGGLTDSGFCSIDAKDQVAELLTHATPKQRSVLEHRLKGMGFGDIGLALGVPHRSARDIYSRFIETCRRQ